MNSHTTTVQRELIQNLAHDINDALGIAISNLDLVIEGDSGGGDRDSLQEALDGCLEIATLFKQLLRQISVPRVEHRSSGWRDVDAVN